MLDLLRVISIVLAFLYIGLNVSFYRAENNRSRRWIVLGRIGMTVAIIVSLAARLFDHDTAAGYIFNLLFIPFVVISTVGLSRAYRGGPGRSS